METSGKPVIRALFFDIGNVLLRFDPQEVLKRFAWAAGRHPLRMARLLWSRKLIDGVERGRVSPRELFEIVRDELGFSEGYAGFRRLWCASFRLRPGAVELMRRAARRRPVYLLSNTNPIHYDFIRRNYAFPGYARGAVLSYRVGLRKPEPAIYQAALRRAGVAAEEALFIDDLQPNVDSALLVGMHAVRYSTTPALARALERFGVL